MKEPNISYSRWEDDEFIICAFGKPIGQTLHEKEARVVAEWLKTAVRELVESSN